jgi:dTDP-4-dehydrorhamnose reductase
MKILLFGNSGQLGWELQRTLPPLGELQAVDYPQIDLSQPESVRPRLREFCSRRGGDRHGDRELRVIVNATGYTAVDKAESEKNIAYAVNALAPGVMAEEARRGGAILIHFSTDYVFDGKKGSPYLETDPTHPLNEYGRGKLAGEEAVMAATSPGGTALILRTSWVYSLRRDSFVAKVLSWSRKSTALGQGTALGQSTALGKDTDLGKSTELGQGTALGKSTELGKKQVLRLVSDQVSGPTWARMLAEITTQVLAMATAQAQPFEWLGERSGIYHLAGSGYASRLEWGTAILRYDPQPETRITREILPALTADFPSPAERPTFSALNCDRFTRIFGLRLPDWKPTLKLAMESLHGG